MKPENLSYNKAPADVMLSAYAQLENHGTKPFSEGSIRSGTVLESHGFNRGRGQTASCIIEAMHVHASDRKLTEKGSAKFFVMSNGDTTVEKQGQLNDREVRQIRAFIKQHYKGI